MKKAEIENLINYMKDNGFERDIRIIEKKTDYIRVSAKWKETGIYIDMCVRDTNSVDRHIEDIRTKRHGMTIYTVLSVFIETGAYQVCNCLCDTHLFYNYEKAVEKFEEIKNKEIEWCEENNVSYDVEKDYEDLFEIEKTNFTHLRVEIIEEKI